jgi:hypothetical protein
MFGVVSEGRYAESVESVESVESAKIKRRVIEG